MMAADVPSTITPQTPGQKTRKPRIITACTSCRDSRVKCDRVKPLCTRCKKGDRVCSYFRSEFLQYPDEEEVRSSNTGSEGSASPVNTWSSIIEQQAGVAKRSNGQMNQEPVWAVAEAEEASKAQDSRLYRRLIKPYSVPISALGGTIFSDLTTQFPSEDERRLFFESFLESIHPIVPVCHIPTLRVTYFEFWRTFSPTSSTETLALILAILSTGSTSITQRPSPLATLLAQILTTLDTTTYHLKSHPSSLHLLQALIIHHTYLSSSLSPFSAYGFLPTTIRFAQSLRLHLDHDSPSSSFTAVEKEVRRRIWWHLVFLDIEATIATGMLPIIYRGGYTTRLPAMVRDEAVINGKGDEVMKRGGWSPMMIALQGHYQWAHRMSIWFETLPSKEEVAQFRILIENLLALIPEHEREENVWATTYLKMQIDRAYCMLGLRFWQLEQYKGTGCQSEVVQTARSFLTHYLKLACLPRQKLAWFVPGLIQPLHALLILLMHISTCPCIAEEEILSRELLDSVFCLRINMIMKESKSKVPEDGKPRIGGGGEGLRNPRYLVLVELRRRVWKKVGWEGDGRGADPWGGRLDRLDVDGEENVQAEDVDVSAQKDVENGVENGDLNDWNGGGIGDMMDITGFEGLESILAGDPLDMLQWDEWESLASEFFVR